MEWRKNTLSKLQDQYYCRDVEEKSKESFKKLVKTRVTESAFEELKQECQEKKKTKSLVYTSFSPQDYLNHLYPSQAQVIFKCRCKTLEIKDHQRYRYNNNTCRRCGSQDETVEHIVNCNEQIHLDTSVLYNMEEKISYDTILQLTLISRRITDFIEEFK